MHRFLSIVWWLSVCSVCSVGTLRSQPANVQADPTTGVLFRPSAATFISGNNLATATGGVVLGANGGTGVANTGKTITLGGNVTTSGAFGLTLTLSGTTNVTLPTSGQLATLSGGEILTNKTLTSPTLTTPILGAATATSLTLSGNISSAAWTTSGVRLKGVAATLTDTTSTGTVAAAYTDVLGGNTIAASNATTFTDYITAYFREPTAGSLVTMTNKWALGGESLRIGTSTPMTVSTTGLLRVTNTTAASSTTSGALQVAGGVGVSGAGYFGGMINGTDALRVLTSGVSIGSLQSAAGDLYISLDQNANGNMIFRRNSGTESMRITGSNGAVNITSTVSASTATTGALTIGNGSGATNVAIGGGNINAGNLITAGSIITGTEFTSTTTSGGFQNTAASTSYKFLRQSNTGGQVYVGIESSVGGGFYTGANAYESVWYSPSNDSYFRTANARFSGNINAGGTGTFVGLNSVTTGATGTTVVAQNTNASGFSEFAVKDSAGTVQVSLAYGNATSGSPYQGSPYIYKPAGKVLNFIGGASVLATLGTTGALQLFDTTASTGVGTGALQVAGGIYAGAASVFAGSISVAAPLGQVAINSTTGTNAAIVTLANTGGSSNIGLENSTGSLFGGTAYALVRHAPSGRVIQDIISGVPQLTISSTTATFAGAVTSTLATGGIGYGTGAGGAVTQITSRTTGVTLSKVSGAITLVSAAGSATWQTFTVTNTTVAATDTIIINQKSGTDLYEVHVTAVGAGSFNVSFKTTGGTTTEQPVFNFAVIKAVTS